MIDNGTKTVVKGEVQHFLIFRKGLEKKPQRLKLSWTQVLTAFVVDEDGAWMTDCKRVRK